jgi:hypothetical protein
MDLYGRAGREVAERNFVPAVWAKAYSDALGDEKQSIALYIKLRVEQLRKDENLPPPKASDGRSAEQFKQDLARAREQVVSGKFTCPNPACRFSGEAKSVPKGDLATGLVLLLLFLVPGILYFLFASGYKYICPRCGQKLRTDIVG